MFESSKNTGSKSSSIFLPRTTLSTDLMTTYQLLFFPRKGKTDKDTKLSPLYCRITCGTRTELTFNKWISAKKWNPKKQRLSGTDPEAVAINAFIQSVIVKFHNIHTTLLNKGEFITAEKLKAHYQGKTTKQKTVMEVFDFYLSQIQSKMDKTYRIATLKKYEYCKNHLKNFLWKNYNSTDIFLTKINLLFVKSFQTYLLEASEFKNELGVAIKKKANDHNSTLKYLKMFKTVLSIALAHNWIDNNPFALFKEKFVEVEQEYLTEDEVKRMIKKEISAKNEKMNWVRDVFVFSCLTGLAYIDLESLEASNIIMGINGNKLIVINCKILAS